MGGYRKKKAILISAFFVLVVIGILAIVKNNVFIEQTLKNDIEYQGTTPLIKDDTSVEQCFRSEYDISCISIKTATYDNELSGVYILEIYDDENSVLYSNCIEGFQIKDNDYLTLRFPETLRANRDYFLSITPEKVDDDTFALWMGVCQNEYIGECYLDGIPTGKSIDIRITVQNTMLPVVIFVLICSFVFLFVLVKICNPCKSILIIYVFATILLILRCCSIYENESLGTYDEIAHISYLAYVENNPEIIPDYCEMKLLISENITVDERVQVFGLDQTKGIYKGHFSNTINYLCHPPLYYFLLLPLDSIEIKEEIVYVDLDVLRLANVLIFTLAILLIFYIGYTRITKNPVLHFLYTMIIISLPMLGYTGVTINNDNLTLLTVAIAFLGAIRINEKKYNIVSYIMIAIGICGTVLTKLTAGMIVVIAAFLFILYKFVSEKEYKCVFNKAIIPTIPIYVMSLMYYICVYSKYDTVQTSISKLVDFETMKQYPVLYDAYEVANPKNLLEYILYFVRCFVQQWANGVYNSDNTEFEKIVSNILFMIPWVIVIIFISQICAKNPETKFSSVFAVGIISTFIYQFITAWSKYEVLGHGATQSRYYLCALFIIAYIVVLACERILDGVKAKSICESMLYVVGYGFFHFGYLIYYV